MLSRFISYMKVQQHNSISFKKARHEYISQEEESNAVNFKSKYIEGHEKQIKNLVSKFQNDLIYKNKNPNDYMTFYYIKPSNFNKTSLTNFPQLTKMETFINNASIGKSIFNLEPRKIISKTKVKQTNSVEWEQDSDESQYKNKPKLKNFFINTFSKTFTGTTKSVYRKKLLSPQPKRNYIYYKDDIDK